MKVPVITVLFAIIICVGKCAGKCRAIKTKAMVFRYMWVYSKEDIMAHTCRALVTS